mgnify:CR=1 FL=1|tara:strand:- start:76916 stop:78265 length:1350 start_codon:yes stop_codon:yes gene_type:complete
MKKYLCLIITALSTWASVAHATDFKGYMYRVEIMTPGGSLPFIVMSDERSSPNTLLGVQVVPIILNGDERLDCDVSKSRSMSFDAEPGYLSRFMRRTVSTTALSFPQFDSVIEWDRWYGYGIENQPSWTGRWIKRRGQEYVELPVVVTPIKWTVPRTDDQRFIAFPDSVQPNWKGKGNFDGIWSVKFESSDDHAIGKFEVDENQIASGTFMTTTGDYRFLAGRVDGNLMRLSTFDGAHAFLFHARMQDDGTIEGDFWSGNWWHETWTAVRDDDAALPDAFEQTVIADEDALDDMVFKNLQGEPTRVLDVLDESNAPARIIEIFGTWCPNCSDAGRELVSLREQYGDNLAVVGLAFEVTEDFERSVQQVKHHHEHIGTDWPILIAGLSDKDKASQALPVLDKVRSYPTLIFLDRHNEVQGVYSGFSGPATGDAYIKQRERFEQLIESMID